MDLGQLRRHALLHPLPDEPVPQGQRPLRQQRRRSGRAYISSASSLHPGGCNFAFADGSVRFLKESINTWPYDPNTGLPVGVTFDPNGPYIEAPKTERGVYQAISTRNGRELVGADAY